MKGTFVRILLVVILQCLTFFLNDCDARKLFDWNDSDFFAKIKDNAVPTSLLDQLTHEAQSVGNQYRTYFLENSSDEPASLSEAVIESLTEVVVDAGCITTDEAKHLSGIEFWIKSIRLSEKGLDFHVDKDEGAAAKNLLTMPLCSAVLFLSDVGGPLMVTQARPMNKDFSKWTLGERRASLVVPVKKNRLAMFGRGFVHGVLPASTQTTATQRRLTLIASWWPKPLQPIAPHCGRCDWKMFSIKPLDPTQLASARHSFAQHRTAIQSTTNNTLHIGDSFSQATVDIDVFPKEQLLDGFKLPEDRRVRAKIPRSVLKEGITDGNPLLIHQSLSSLAEIKLEIKNHDEL